MWKTGGTAIGGQNNVVSPNLGYVEGPDHKRVIRARKWITCAGAHRKAHNTSPGPRTDLEHCGHEAPRRPPRVVMSDENLPQTIEAQTINCDLYLLRSILVMLMPRPLFRHCRHQPFEVNSFSRLPLWGVISPPRSISDERQDEESSKLELRLAR